MGNLTTYKFFLRNRLKIHVEIISLGQMGSSDLKLMVGGGGGEGSWGKMAKMADGMKMSKNSEKKMKKNEMVSDSATDSPS